MLNWIQTMDEGLMLWIQSVRVPALNGIISAFTKLGHAGMLWIAISLVLLCFRRTRRAGVLSLIAMGVGYLLNDMVLKNLVCRIRPYLAIAGLEPVGVLPTSYSFPSGHACCAMAAVNAWWRTLDRRWLKVTLLVLGILMCLSRPYVGAHYVTDVLIGALVGSLVGQLVWLVSKRVRPPRQENK